MVADTIRGAYRSDGAAEDTETFVKVGELGMFGVFVAARPKSVVSFRMKEIAQEAKELFERRLAEEMDAFKERLPYRAAKSPDIAPRKSLSQSPVRWWTEPAPY